VEFARISTVVLAWSFLSWSSLPAEEGKTARHTWIESRGDGVEVMPVTEKWTFFTGGTF